MDRRMTFGVLAALLSLSLWGCEKRGQEPADANQTTSAALKEKADQALQATTGFLAEQKDKLLQASQEQLDKLEQQADEWLSEVDTDDEQVRQKLTTMSQRFREALGEARQALEKARNSGLDAWQQAKPTVEAAVKKAQQARDEVMTFLKGQAQKQARQPDASPDGDDVEE